MKLTKFRAALLASTLVLMPFAALAQTVVALPTNVASGAIKDLGNGPTELRVLGGNLGIFTSQGSGIGSTSGSSTVLTTTAAPTPAPCVGCIISGTGITSGTTVVSSAATGINLSAAMTVAASTALAWGVACPSPPPTVGIALVQASVGGDFPLYTQARVCAYGGTGPGATVLQFAIGAH
jgi:hypothetical protein